MAKYANRVSKPTPTNAQRTAADPRTAAKIASGTTSESRTRLQLQRMVDEKESAADSWQMKLKVAPARDAAELEADAAAHEVVHGRNEPRTQVRTQPSLAQRINRRPTEVQRAAEEEIQEMPDEEVSAKQSLQRMRESGTDEPPETPLQRNVDEDAQMMVDEDAQMMVDEDAQMMVDEDAQMMADEDAQMMTDEDAQMRAKQKVRRKATPSNHAQGFTTSENTHQMLRARKGMGEPLPEPVKSEMEAGFQTDLSDVRIHRDQSAAELNRQVAAKAFTTGRDVFFAAGEYDDQSAAGKELIAHELTHTIQQDAIKPDPQTAPQARTSSSPSGISAQAADPVVPQSPATAKLTPQKATAGQEKQSTGPQAKSKGKAKGPAASPAAPKLSPTDPKDDPAFQVQIAHVKATATQQQAHPDAAEKVAEVDAAALLPESDQEFARDGGAHLIGMDEEVPEKKEPISAEGFKKILAQNLDDLEKQLPDTEDEAEDFKEQKPIKGIKDNIAAQVKAENEAVSGPLAKTAGQKEPPQRPEAGAILAEQPLLAQDPGKAPKNINPRAAVPKPKHDQEISMEEESEDLDKVMEKHDVTEGQLANSNEPKFTGALESKNKAQNEAAQAPKRYRKQEQSTLDRARAYAQKHGKDKLIAMYGTRAQVLLKVLGGQKGAEKQEETDQERIHRSFEENYNLTKEDVTKRLDDLTDYVDENFEQDAERAMKTFEENVEKQIDAIYGWTVIDDWIFGADTEAIEAVFVREKARFLRTMNGILDRIAAHIAQELNAALDRIKLGKAKHEELYSNLSDSEKKLAQDSYEGFKDQYSDLEETVYEQQDTLAADLAQSYKENVDSLRETFEKIRNEVAAGWIGKAFQALMWVINKIIEISKMLFELLAAVVEAIGAIISDPIGFLSNLIDGVSEGFNNFVKNIKTHIITGLIEWLTGSLGGVGISLPENIFSLRGVFSLVLQVLGLTWDYFRNRAVKLLGEKVVGAMEYGFELFQRIRTGGIEALWEEVKEKFQDLQTVVMDAIRDMVITKVIEAGVKWIMGLLNPAGAFIKAAMLIIDVAKFFIERAAQIFELVRAFTDGIRAIARGNVAGVAKAIETALAKAIPVLISFLAALVGVTGLTKKVQKIIKKIRKRINKAIDKVIKKARKIFRRGGKGTKKGKGQDKDGLTAKDKQKHVKIATEVKDKLEKAPKKGFSSFEAFHADRKKRAKELEGKYGPKVRKKVKGKTVKLRVDFLPTKKDEKDGDVDFKVIIAPNATIVPGASASGGGGTFYPGSGIDPAGRSVEQLWRDADPRQPLQNEATGQNRQRASMARDALINHYGANKKKIIKAILRANYGQTVRKFTNVREEARLNSGAHTHLRHIRGSGYLPTQRDQALRIVLNDPRNPGRAGYFKSVTIANNSLKKTILQHMGGSNWKAARDRLIQVATAGGHNNKLELRGPLGGGSFNLQKTDPPINANYSIPRDLPKYLNRESVTFKGNTLMFPGAAGERPLWKRDPRKVRLRDPHNPLTTEFSATKTFARIVTDTRIDGGWYVNSSWPE
ncbi:MAG: DUF4157 domain-containing protein [Bacteroidota bacterium]